MRAVMGYGDSFGGGRLLARCAGGGLEAEIAELRRQARMQSTELAALLERLDELQGQVSRHQQYLDRGRP